VTPLQFLLVLHARIRVFAAVFIATVIATAIVSLVIPKTYVATASLLVDVKDEQSLSNPLLSARQQIGYVQTQIDIITSTRVAKKVVRDLHLAENPIARANFQAEAGGGGSIEDWLAETLVKRVKIDTSSSQSSVLQLQYSATDAGFAAAIANAFAKAYIETTLELRVEPTRQAALWFDEQLKVLRETLETAQANLTAYQKRTGIVVSDERLDNENARLSEMSTQLTQVQSHSYDLQTRRQQAQEFLSRGASPDIVPEVLSNSFIQGLKNEILRSEAKLQEMGTQLGVNHPQYQRQQSELRSLRAKLETEMRKVISGLNNSERQNSERAEELRAALAAQKDKVLQLKEFRDQVAVLARDVETAQRAYETALQRSTTNRVESRASQTNVALLSPAIEPSRASRPRIWLNIALAAVIGAMLGAAVVFLQELADPKLRSLSGLAAELGAPLLGMLSGPVRSPGRWARALRTIGALWRRDGPAVGESGAG
jgi:succinoglycan biosynthesis transport protein ExoP